MEDYSQKQIGKKIREIRKTKGISIHKVSTQTGLTSSFISQFERGLTSASIDSIIKIVDAIGVKMSILFNDNINLDPRSNKPFIIRKNERSSLSYLGLTNNDLEEYLLTHPNSKLEVYISILNPGISTTGKYYHNGEEEFLLILEGELDIEVENDQYILNKGDTITLDCSLPRSWKNNSQSVTRILWIIYR